MAVNRVPKQARKVGSELVLARGEVTGHAHRIVEGQAFLYRLATGILYLRVLSEFAKLYRPLKVPEFSGALFVTVTLRKPN